MSFLGSRGLTLVASHPNVWVGLQVLREEVAQGVVFLLQHKVGRVGHARVDLLFNLLLTIGEQEELETVWRVHLELLVGGRPVGAR
jgi:hypothetical protein